MLRIQQSRMPLCLPLRTRHRRQAPKLTRKSRRRCSRPTSATVTDVPVLHSHTQCTYSDITPANGHERKDGIVTRKPTRLSAAESVTTTTVTLPDSMWELLRSVAW